MNSSPQQRKERLDRGIKARSEDIFALYSWREITYQLFPRVFPIACILLIALLAPPYWKKVLLSAANIGMLAISWDFLARAGMVSLGHALPFGIGGYMAGALNHYLGWEWWLTLPISAIGGALICTLLLLPVLRLRGIYFSMVTLVLPLILVRLIEATRILGGTEGYSGLMPFPNLWVELIVSLLALGAAFFGLRRLITTDYGLVLQGVRDNDRAIIRAGLSVFMLKAQAVFIASVVAAFTGAFLTHQYMFVGMPAFALDYSILAIAASVVGGMGTLAGPALGAFILVPLSEILRSLGPLRIVFYGIFLVVFVVAIPEGLFHYMKRKYYQFEHWVKVES